MERSRVRAVQIDNLRALQGIRITNKVQSTWVREFCGVKKAVDGKIDDGVLQCFNHVERMTELSGMFM